MDLSNDARELLASARHANAAPTAARERGRQRLTGTLAVGALTTIAGAAKGATLLSSTAASTVGAAASTSFTAAWIGAIAIGFSVGVIAQVPLLKNLAEPTVSEREAGVARKIPLVVPASNHVTPSTFTPQDTPQPTEEAIGPTTTTTTVPVTSTPKLTKVSIARETELLADVQRALKANNPQAALARLERYADEYPTGLLIEEATASRVVALCALRRWSDGKRWADEFFRLYPHSPLVTRVREACSVPHDAPNH